MSAHERILNPPLPRREETICQAADRVCAIALIIRDTTDRESKRLYLNMLDELTREIAAECVRIAVEDWAREGLPTTITELRA